MSNEIPSTAESSTALDEASRTDGFDRGRVVLSELKTRGGSGVLQASAGIGGIGWFDLFPGGRAVRTVAQDDQHIGIG